jgi:predicted acyl esterase
MRKLGLLVLVVAGSLLLASSAQATIPQVFGGDLQCRNFDANTPGNTGDDQRRCTITEVQQLTVDATGGTYTLSFTDRAPSPDTETTGPIAENATADTVDAALEGLSNIPSGAVQVSGPDGGPYTIVLWIPGDQNQITADSTNLTGGTATASVTTLTEGVPRTTSGTWDDTPIDVNVALPAEPSSGSDGPYPLVIWGHGYGGAKLDFSAMKHWTDRGYAVFSMTDRGFHESCGTDDAITAAAGACDEAGWIHLMDDRYEVRDAQFFAGELADENVVDGQRVGAIGGSYGGGLSLQLASLKDRTMMPNGSLVPWTSPMDHHPMQIAAASPNIPWSDLAYSLTPNGQKLDYVADTPYTGRIGVQKQSFVGGLYFSGFVAGRYCGQPPYPTCTDFGSDVTAWNTRLNQGEPYDGDPTTDAVFNEIKAHHSAYYIDHSVPPAPLLISNGFTDDLFPADEAITYFNRIRSQYPNAPISLFFGDFGHPRGANKDSDADALNAAQDAWLDFYVKGTGSQPFQGATTFAPTCPKDADHASLGPYQAGSWAGLQKGEVRLDSAAAKVIEPAGGSEDVDKAFDPITAGNPCTTAPSADLPGVATYRLPAATGSGFTLMGSPTVVAKINSPEPNSEVAARLLDVDPNGTETLVDRQLLRPLVGSAKQVFQLHPTGHLFAAGHVAKLELLPGDSHGEVTGGYGRAANGQGQVTISDLSLRLPTLDGPGAGGGAVKSASALALPCGVAIAPQYSSSEYVRATLGSGKLTLKGRKASVPVDSAPGANACQTQVTLLGAHKAKKKKKKGRAAKKKKKGKKRVLGRGSATIAGGQSKTVKVKLSKAGRAALAHGGKVRVQVTTIDSAGNTVQLTKAKVKVKGGKHKKHKK